MKDTIWHHYDIKIIGLMKLGEHVYKAKCESGCYVIKITTHKNLQAMYEYVETLHIHCFVPILINKNQEYLTPYQESYLYVMPFIDNGGHLLKEMKIQFYFETMAYLHAHSFYYTKVNQQYFQTLQKDITQIINERFVYYEQMIESCENEIYRSPSQWLLVMNYYRIHHSLLSSRQYLSQYMQQVQDCHQIRVCLNYKNFDYDHISVKEKCLLSLDHLCMDLPIYDLFDIYQRIPDILFDLDCFSDYYLKKVELKSDEKLLLSCLMNIVPIIRYEDDEIDNIIKLSRLLYYLDSIHNFIAQL